MISTFVVEGLLLANEIAIRSFSGLHFLPFGLNMEIKRVKFRIQSECEKIRTKQGFYAVCLGKLMKVNFIQLLQLRKLHLYVI